MKNRSRNRQSGNITNRLNKLERHIESARSQAEQTRQVQVITVIVNPDAPDQYFTGTIAGRFDIAHHID